MMNTFKKICMVLTLGLMLAPIAADAQKKAAGIVAHRGFWNCEEAGYAKNSIAALRCAQEAGCWGSEFDVNMTSDGVLLVYHDSDIQGKKIEKHPYSEFKDFKIKNGETIPTIDEFLEQAKKYPKTMLLYELKPHSCAEVEDKIVELALANLEKHGLLKPNRVMFISFSYHMCKVVAEKLPKFTVQFLGGGKAPEVVKADKINGIDYNQGVFAKHPEWVKDAQDRGMSVNAWTVNKEEGMKKMLDLGVNQLTTDQPLEARKVMKEMGIKEIVSYKVK